MLLKTSTKILTKVGTKNGALVLFKSFKRNRILIKKDIKKLYKRLKN